MDLSSIKPDLIVHAHAQGTIPAPDDVHIGHVDHVDGDYIKLKRTFSEDGRHHWIPLEWVDRVNEQGVFLNKNVEEYLWGRLDEKPAH